MFYNVVGCVVNTNICQELDVEVLLLLPNCKNPICDDITNDVFKKYACMLISH